MSTSAQKPRRPRASRYEQPILRSLRRISRAIDLYSRKLTEECGVTGPQLICLRLLSDSEGMQPSALAREMSLSRATVTGIIDRLAARNLITRTRSDGDRRAVSVVITQEGRAILEVAPSLLQDRFAERLGALTEENQQIIHVVLEQIVGMMNAGNIDVAPLLTTGPADAAADQLEKFLRATKQVNPPLEDPKKRKRP